MTNADQLLRSMIREEIRALLPELADSVADKAHAGEDLLTTGAAARFVHCHTDKVRAAIMGGALAASENPAAAGRTPRRLIKRADLVRWARDGFPLEVNEG